MRKTESATHKDQTSLASAGTAWLLLSDAVGVHVVTGNACYQVYLHHVR